MGEQPFWKLRNFMTEHARTLPRVISCQRLSDAATSMAAYEASGNAPPFNTEDVMS